MSIIRASLLASLLATLPMAVLSCQNRSGGTAATPVVIAGDMTRPLPEDFHRGVNYAHIHSRGHGYGSEASSRELDSLHGLGIDWIAITPFGFQQAATADSIIGFPRKGDGPEASGRRDRSMNEEDIIAEVATAHRLGIKVTMKPHIWSRDFWNGGEWQGTIRQNSPEEHARWWSSFREFALYYAGLSERSKADLFCIGTELAGITPRYPDEWRGLIADIRKVYHGQLGYAAHWEHEFDSVTFWDALDYVGITAYFPLNVPDSASVDDLVRAWGPHRKRIEAIAARYNKPVLFLEAGYRPSTTTYRTPWVDQGGDPNPAMQARAYEAMFRAFHDAPWWRGVYFWKVFSDPASAEEHGEDNGFSFRNMPAQDVVRRWFTAR
ncbi:MAG: hypothetical protein ABI876_03915 [Bacteroidota bacterium]